MQKKQDNVIILFAKEPIEGKVKTRLIPALGEHGAYQLYCQFLDNLMCQFNHDTLTHFLKTDFLVYTSPEHLSKPSYFNNQLVKQQLGCDIGRKMYNAMAQELLEYKKVILFGADCPFLTKEMIKQAFHALDEFQHVFVPVVDGGYVLIGSTISSPEIFSGIDWSTPHVMQQTRDNLNRLKHSYSLLPELNDIDEESDLEKLQDLDEFSDFLSNKIKR